MSPAGSIVDQVIAALEANSSLMALATGKVWNRQLQAEGEGATPDAFDPEKPWRMRPTIAVVDLGDIPHLGGMPEQFDSYPRIWFFAPAHASGRATILQMQQIVRTICYKLPIVIPGTTWRGFLIYAGERFGIRDSPEFPGNVYDWDRYKLSGFWREV